MGRGRPILVSLALFMFLGVAVYFRLWTIDSTFSSEDRDLIRRQFDLANKEAMDESAEWRLKYDTEVERSRTCGKELMESKEALEKKAEENSGFNNKLDMLQKENIGLLDRVETLKQELESEKLKCSLQQT